VLFVQVFETLRFRPHAVAAAHSLTSEHITPLPV
jgi:hypothetical protein